MRIDLGKSKKHMAEQAAKAGAELIRKAIRKQGEATIILATGASQFEMLEALLAEPGVKWEKVTIFHLDEYIGLPITHPASFRRYLWQRFARKLEVPPAGFVFINGEAKDPQAECRRLGKLIGQREVDVAFIGIGENGHVAFNDPPADFKTKAPYLVVKLDTACRRQQMGEGWFKNLAAVPKEAISMSVGQIMKSKAIICTVPDERKAEAVRNSLEGPVTPLVPASILQAHMGCTVYLDPASASLLGK